MSAAEDTTEATDQPAATGRFAASGLHYHLDGPETAQPLVLAHALGTDATLWAPQLAAFAQAYRVIRYDARGHGASPLPAGPGTIDALGRDVLALLDELGVARAAFVGISLGGLTGLWLGVHAADRLAGLVVSNAAPRIATPAVWEDRIRLVATEGLAPIAEGAPGRWFTPAFIDAQPDAVARARRLIAGTSPIGYSHCCEALRDADLTASLGRIQAPTLLLAGAFDAVTTTADAHAMAAAIPLAQACELACAHLSNVEAAAAFNHEVLAFLARLDAWPGAGLGELPAIG